jgi:hypothetical protein
MWFHHSMKLTVSASHLLILRIDYMVTKCLSGSHMEKTYSFSFPESQIFLAKPFHHCRLKGNVSGTGVVCDYVCFQ